METVKIKRWLTGYGNGNGYGDGNGDGDGNGYGDGDGNGYGNGNGDGNGYGDGYGYGNGNGYGDGNGDGDGNGYGDGYGYGDGNGDGDGDGLQIQAFKDKPVYYIDNIPCSFISLKGDVALVDTINPMDFTATQMYVAKREGLFAHAPSIKEAIAEVEKKWIANRSVEERIIDFKDKFKKSISYNTSLFYEWHSILTGSCKSGKDMWLHQQGIDLKGKMTVDKFFELTKDAYGGETIRRLMKDYK